MSHYLRLPTPKKFLGFFDLQYGTEIVLMSLLINKCSGVFGVLAIFSGAHISLVQLSMYFYSLSIFGLLCYLTPRIHHRDPLAALSFAYIYLIDSLINIGYTLLFAVTWFLALASKHSSAAGQTISDPSGIASPSFNISHLDAVAATADSIMGGQDAVGVGMPAEAGIGAGMLQPESATSILIIAIFWTVRLYFVVIAFAWARQIVRASATPSDGPFEGRNGGAGWQGRLGRAMISVRKSYWQGNGWAPLGSYKFRRSSEPLGRRFSRRDNRLSVEV